jgi:predicted nucleic acid-binding protein
MPTLPLLALIDTGVFIRRLGDQPECADTPACIEFCDRMAALNRRIFVAAPTIAEVTRIRGAAPPRVRNIITVAFDEVAAEELGRLMPMSELRSCLAKHYGCRQNHIKYDALIVGCALRIPGVAFVGLDDKQLQLARAVRLDAHRPHEYLAEGPRSPEGEQQPLSGLE